jgi:hypothetical protein
MPDGWFRRRLMSKVISNCRYWSGIVISGVWRDGSGWWEVEYLEVIGPVLYLLRRKRNVWCRNSILWQIHGRVSAYLMFDNLTHCYIPNGQENVFLWVMGKQDWQDSSPLCCCEYWNIQQERSHILGCCCNCEDLDESVERL